MSLDLATKKNVVAEVAEVAATSNSVVAAEYIGLTVAQVTALRASARASGVHLRVVKNSLARRAFEGTDFECLKPSLVGPLMLAFSREDPAAAARMIKEFLKDKANSKFVVKTLAIGGQVLPATDLDRVASLPSRDEAISMLMACMRAPLDKFARTVNEIPGKLVRTVDAVRLQKQSA